MRKFLTIRKLAVAAIFLIVGGGWWWRGQSNKDRGEDKKVVTVVKKDLTDALSVSGKVSAGRIAVLNFPVAGKLAFARVAEGDKVDRGEWLMGLDTGDLKALETKSWYAYMAADANAKEVEDKLKGHDKDETYTQKNERVAAQTVRDSAYESWLSARRAVDNSVLKSPFSGIVTELTTLAVGDTVGVADGVTVVDPASLYFEIEIDESDLEKVYEGQEVIVDLDAYEKNRFSGIIIEIGFVSKLSDTGATVFLAKVKFATEELSKLRIGMNGDANIILNKVYSVLVVPIEAVVDGVVEREKGEKISVKTGLETNLEMEIRSGLNEGDRVVVR